MGKQTKKGPLRCNAKSNPDPDTQSSAGATAISRTPQLITITLTHLGLQLPVINPRDG
jgi:hypothetical protein